MPKNAQTTAQLLSSHTLLLLLLSHFSRVRLCATPETAAHQLPHPWDSPGKNTGVGCHFLLQCMKAESEVAQSCPTLSGPMDCSLPGSSVHGIFQARVLEWGAIAFSGFHVLAVVNSAAVNIGVHVSFSVMFFSGYMPSNGIVSVTMFLQGCLLF